MYHTYMSERESDLRRLDAALLALRRLTSAPTPHALRERRGPDVEVSTMLVVDAVARCDHDRGCSIQDVAQALTVAHSTASRLVDRAVRAGMLTRARDGDHGPGRRTVLRLTTSGAQLQIRAVGYRTGLLAAVTADWSPADIGALTGLMERFAADAHPHLCPTGRNQP
jgi:DNA-binding MarR family transcriptional regulator